MDSRKNISFYINPVSGGKKKDRLIEYLKVLKERGDFCGEIYISSGPGDISEKVKQDMAGETKVFVAVGGDGTLNEVASAIKGTDKILGIVPFGSGNGYARHFKIPLNFRKAVSKILLSDTHVVDMGEVNGKYFCATSGIGFDADIGHYFTNFSNRGFISYGLSFFRIFLSYKALEYNINFDGGEINVRAFFINVANTSQYGSNFHVAPSAVADDGMLDLIVLKKFPKIIVPGLLFRSYFASLERSRYIMHYRLRNIRISAVSAKNRIHVDGEPDTSQGDLEFKCLPACLRIIY